MGFLKKLFGGGDPLSAINRAVQQQRWADVLRLGEGIERDKLPEPTKGELDSTLELAGNRLAEINILEGEACLRSDDKERACEHFMLASEHARDDDLKRRAEQLLMEAPGLSSPSAEPPSVAGSCCSSGCRTDSPGDSDENVEWDMETRLELALSSYPSDWVERYDATGIEFKRALLLSHDELHNDALVAFEAVPDSGRDDLFHFERGSLLVRMDEHVKGREDLERAIELNPRHELALETLVSLDLAVRNLPAAETRLHSMLALGLAPAFSYSRLAMISAGRGDDIAAIGFGEKALAEGPIDVETLMLQSSLLEKSGRLDEAEALLANLPGGGCGGGAHVLLAEFWLRHGKSLEKALESFKGVSRQEPTNLRWPMRIAQTYLALGWRKDGQVMMEKVLSVSDLDEVLRQEAEEILDFYGK